MSPASRRAPSSRSSCRSALSLRRLNKPFSVPRAGYRSRSTGERHRLRAAPPGEKGVHVRSKFSLTLAVAAIVATLAGATVAPAANAASNQQPAATANTVTGLTQHLTDTQGNLVYDLTATVTKFVNQNGKLLATGTLSGTVTDTVSGLVTTLTNQ